VGAAEEELRRLRCDGELVDWKPAGRVVRPGSWDEQAQPTPDRIDAAVREQRLGDAAGLSRHLVTEAQEIHDLYTQWATAIPQILLRLGVAPDEVANAAKRVVRSSGAADPAADWANFAAVAEAFAAGCERAQPGDLATVLEVWRGGHDRHLDLVAGWVAVAVESLGEAGLGTLWRELEGEGIAAYGRYDPSHTPWERSFGFVVQSAIEGMHGHLGGPRGVGEVEVADHADRVELTFAPCGSGGRLRAAERFGVTSQPHDWAWNEVGVCHYCVHCCVLQQLEPIDNLGFPVRVIDPPLQAGDPCRWTIYRDPADIPESAYRRVGRSRPR
jgi:hypothetical protein